jgi:hypothetical protein
MIELNVGDEFCKLIPCDKIEYPDKVPLRIRDGKSLHEAPVSGYQLQDSGFLPRTSVAYELDVPNARQKLLIKHQLQDLELPTVKINSSLDPKFDLILDPEASLLRVVPNEIRRSLEHHHIVIFHMKKIGRIRMDSKTFGNLK